METAKNLFQGFSNLLRKVQPVLCVVILTEIASGQELMLPPEKTANGTPLKAVSTANMNSNVNPRLDTSNPASTNEDTIRRFLSGSVLERKIGDVTEPEEATFAAHATTLETLETTELPPLDEKLIQVQATENEPIASTSLSLPSALRSYRMRTNRSDSN